MNHSKKAVSVHILDKDYQVACEPEDEPLLVASAQHLDNSMRGIRATGKVVGSDRIAVMAALNVTNDMLHGQRQSSEGSKAAEAELLRLHQKLDQAIENIKLNQT